MNPGVYGPLDSATNLYTGLTINKQMVSTSATTTRDANLEAADSQSINLDLKSSAAQRDWSYTHVQN